MTDKERLEEIKNSYLEGLHSFFGTPWVSMPKENSDWLIEQAGRVQELEEHIDHLYDNNVHLKGDYRLQEQNKRYREALKNIYELAEYDEYDNTLEQIVSEIEKALESDEN